MKRELLIVALVCAVAPGAFAQGEGPRAARAPEVGCTKTETLVKLASPEVARAAGLELAEVVAAPLSRSITRNAEVDFNANRYARLSSRAQGVVGAVHKDLGERVAAGDVLAVVDSIDVGAAKSELIAAAETVKLRQSLSEKERELQAQGYGTLREQAVADAALAESKITLAKSRQRLRNLGFSAAQIDRVESEGDTSSLLEVLAPFDGLIVERSAVMGEVVEPGRPLLAVADTSAMWAMIDLTEQDATDAAINQRIVLTLDALPGRQFPGKLTWISTQLDPKTRTLKARAELANDGGLLRAHMFGRTEIMTRTGEPAAMIPRAAVQWEGCCNVAFVPADESGAAFRPVKIHLGYATDTHYEVLSGLAAGDRVVTTGSFVLKTEILKGSIGAGCCEVDHLKK